MIHTGQKTPAAASEVGGGTACASFREATTAAPAAAPAAAPNAAPGSSADDCP